MQSRDKKSLIFIDSTVQHADVLAEAVHESFAIHRLTDGGDAFAEMAKVISGTTGIRSLGILAHGAPGSLDLNGQRIDRTSLRDSGLAFDSMARALAPDARIVLISCSTGAGRNGRAFVSDLSDRFGAPVEASESDLGSGAGWRGLPAAEHFFDRAALDRFPGRLAVINGTIGADNITGTADADNINSDDGNDTISALGGDDTVSHGDGASLIYLADGNDHSTDLNGDDTIYGGDGNDTFVGTSSGRKHYYGENGDDRISTAAQNDFLYGGSGNDYAQAGSGNDLLYGGTGNDTLSGGDNSDQLYGEDGDDSLEGNPGSDLLWGGNGSDILLGGFGTDTISGGSGDDTLSGSNGSDLLHGGAGADVFYGTAADFDGDTISGLENGDQIVITGDTSFANTLHATAVGGSLTLGTSTITLSDSETGLYYSAEASGGNTLLTLTDSNPNAAIATSNSTDQLTKTERTEEDFAGLATDHTLINNRGIAAAGTIIDDSGNENFVVARIPHGLALRNSGTAIAEASETATSTLIAQIESSSASDTSKNFFSEEGREFAGKNGGKLIDVRTISFTGTLNQGEAVELSGIRGSVAPAGAEAIVIEADGLGANATVILNNIDFASVIGAATVTGGAGRNHVVGDEERQFISLGAEDDTLAGGGGDDTVGSAFGEDLIYGNRGNDYLFGGGGMDSIYGGQESDTVIGGNDNDVVYGNRGTDILYGGQDDDRAYGGQGNDIVYGNGGNDRLNGNLGNDTLYGGQDNDLLFGQSGDDYLAGNTGDDTLEGGDGADTFVFSFGGGNDTVTDFTAGTDTLALEAGLGVAGATEENGSTIVTFSDGGTVTLIGVNQSTLAAATGWEFG